MIESIDPRGMSRSRRSPPPGMLVTDLDGTLFGSSKRLADADREALEALGDAGYVRVVATGRNPHSFMKAAGNELPIDFAILSSGAAVLEYPSRRYLRIVSLEAREVWEAAEVLLGLELDLMILDPLPDNHHFAYHPGPSPCPDYRRRIEIYQEFARPLVPGLSGGAIGDRGMRALWPGPASQLLGMDPNDSGRNAHERARRLLTGYTVIRATSPLGGDATWIEVFPPGASKSKGTAWLAAELGLGADKVLAVGNDYNDVDLLEWGGTSFVVSNAPEDLRSRFPAVASSDAGGVAEAVSRWRPALGRRAGS